MLQPKECFLIGKPIYLLYQVRTLDIFHKCVIDLFLFFKCDITQVIAT